MNYSRRPFNWRKLLFWKRGREDTSQSYSQSAFWSKVRTYLMPGWVLGKLYDGTIGFLGFHTPVWAKQFTVPSDSLKFSWNPFFWVVWLFRFVGAWVKSRPWTSIGPTLPAIAVACALIVLYVKKANHNLSDTREFYSKTLVSAKEAGDFDTAAVAIGSLIDFFPQNQSYRFERAVIEEERGNHEAATELMTRLVVREKYAPAAAWLASNEFDIESVADWDAETHGRFRAMMAMALENAGTEDAITLKLDMAKYLSRVGAKNDALPYMISLAELDSMFSLTTALLAKEAGNPELTRQYAEKAVRHLQEKLTAQPGEAESRFQLAQALLMLEREQEAAVILRDGYQYEQDPRFSDGIAEALITWANRLGQTKSRGNLIRRLQLIRQATEASPNNPLVTDAIISITLECKDDRNEEIATLRSAAVQGLDPASIHFIRGTIALFNNDYSAADTHLRLAAKDNQNLPGILNNLAMAISARDQDPESQELALKLTNNAMEALPNHPYILETRGQIFFKMGRIEEAIVDLEKALAASELRAAIYPVLVKCYRQLGQDEIADDYELALKSVSEGQ